MLKEQRQILYICLQCLEPLIVFSSVRVFGHNEKRIGFRVNASYSLKNVEHLIAGAHGVIIHLAGGALFVAVPVIVPSENPEPRTVLVVNEVFPTIRPNTFIPIP